MPGLSAKPIIDIQISVETLHPVDAHAPLLERLGYSHPPHADDDPCPFFHRPATWPHRFHIHLVEAGGDEERRTLVFRDYLRAHLETARDYEALKRQLAIEHRGLDAASREAYAIAKTAFVERILALAGES